MNGDGATLDLPDHGLKTKHGPDGPLVFDPARRKWVALTPEEWVRQHFLAHLVYDLGCPLALIGVEQSLRLNGRAKRADIVVHDREGSPLLLVECKAPGVRLDRSVFEQAARYNVVFHVRYLIVTNGRTHYCCLVDHEQGAVTFLPRLPDYATMGSARA
ncbi:MAG: type I restriction enzyme HsdR N-terminal domain-containing protein [Flavobacteriales bacterium]|nr:type I restriction enzyme HsdR N-terminal domain-containing protein [Flavobacteriales bacterium]MCB9167651.1 type I restriction enzyme HsdR N-terminal domain-containing protein [Flavobacteriales bacterium]